MYKSTFDVNPLEDDIRRISTLNSNPSIPSQASRTEANSSSSIPHHGGVATGRRQSRAADKTTSTYPSDPPKSTVTKHISPVASSICHMKIAPNSFLESKSMGPGRSTSLRCARPGCGVTFGRAYELNRHIAYKHGGHARFECPAKGCYRAEQKQSWPRADKLTAHIRHAHGAQTVYDCVETGCTTFLPHDDMFVHLHRHVLSSATPPSTITKAVLNGLSPAFSRCPVSICSATVPLFKLRHHLLDRHSKEIAYMHQELLEFGYLYKYSPCDQHEKNHHGESFGPVESISVICPVCECQCNDHKQFYAHFVPSHVLRDAEHFQSWTTQVKAELTRSGYGWISSQPDLDAAWNPWQLTLLSDKYIDLDILCPVCAYHEKVSRGGPIVHHLGMLADSQVLLPHRRKILGLYPKFASHPVFHEMQGASFDIVEVFRLRELPSTLVHATENDSYLDSYDNSGLTSAHDASHQTFTAPDMFYEVNYLYDFSDRDCMASLGDSTGTKNVENLDIMADLDQSAAFNNIFFLHETTDITNLYLNGADFYSTNPDMPMLSGFGGQFEPDFANTWPGVELEASPITHDSSRDGGFLITRSEGLPACGDSLTLQPNSIANVLHGAGSSSRTPSASYESSIRSKAYPCEFTGCSRAYERRAELKHHQRSHMSYEERPHGCDQCSQRFVYSRDLQRHLQTHTRSERNNACSFAACGKKFARKDHLIRHEKDVHGQDYRIS